MALAFPLLARVWDNARGMEQELADSPRQFLDGLKSTIFRRRIGQIALAVVLAQACIRFLNALVWYFVIPVISNALNGHTESVLFKERRTFAWEPLMGNFIDFAVALAFVYFANRWIMNSASRPPGVNGQTSESSSVADNPSELLNEESSSHPTS